MARRQARKTIQTLTTTHKERENIDRTIEIMAGQETAPAETPAGGTLPTDFGEQLILLGNRLTAIETALATLTKQLEREPEPEPEIPAEETEPEPEIPAEETEPEQETPAESEEES